MLSRGEEKQSSPRARVPRVAIDIETTGPRFVDHIIQIGIARGTCASDIQSASWCFECPGWEEAFEERCLRTFWSQPAQRAVLERIKREALPADAQWAAFVEEWDTRFGGDALLVSDNPAFDLTRIDLQLAARGLRAHPLRYTREGAYRAVCDLSEREDAIPEAERRRLRAELDRLSPAHDHWAAHDAHRMLVHHFLVEDWILTQQANERRRVRLLRRAVGFLSGLLRQGVALLEPPGRALLSRMRRGVAPAV